jgi:hypothetical protein
MHLARANNVLHHAFSGSRFLHSHSRSKHVFLASSRDRLRVGTPRARRNMHDAPGGDERACNIASTTYNLLSWASLDLFTEATPTTKSTGRITSQPSQARRISQIHPTLLPQTSTMLQYRNAGMSHQENSERIDITRASFASLPGELRNLTYVSTLLWKHPITLKYDPASKHFHAPDFKLVSGRTPLQTLELFSSLDHNIRTEARSYFFANNVFVLETKQSVIADADYVQTYITFLENIGETGRRSIRWLRLTVSRDSKHHVPTFKKGIKLWELISDCANLVTLDVFVEIDYFYMDRQACLKSYLSTEGFPVREPWPVVLESVKQLLNLKRLVLRPVFSGRWRYFDVCVTERLGATSVICGADSRTVQFRGQRPIDEAARLADQVKGYVRRGLRGFVSVRVLTTETWDLYGRELVFRCDRPDTAEWGLCKVDVVKPYERTFQYSNGLNG